MSPIIFRVRFTEANAVDCARCHDLLLVRRSIRRIVIGFTSFLAALSPGAMLVSGYLGLETPLTPKVVTVLIPSTNFGLMGVAVQCVQRRTRPDADHLEGLYLLRASMEPRRENFQRFRTWFAHFIPFEASDFLRGNRCEITPLQATLFPEPHERRAEGFFALLPVLPEPVTKVRIELVKDRIGRRFIVAQRDSAAVV